MSTIQIFQGKAKQQKHDKSVFIHYISLKKIPKSTILIIVRQRFLDATAPYSWDPTVFTR